MRAGRRGSALVFVAACVAAAVSMAVACTGDDPELLPVPGGASDASTSEGDGAPLDGAPGATDAPVDAGSRSVACGSGRCIGIEVCCRANQEDAGCTDPSACTAPGGTMACDDRADCPADRVCCANALSEDPADADTDFVLSAACAPTCNTQSGELVLCSTPDDCPDSAPSCVPVAPEFRPFVRYCL